MFIKKNFYLKKFNTFGINVSARYFVEVKSIEEIQKIFDIYPSISKLFLGNGSNILFLKNYYDGIVMKMGIKGKKVIKENDNQVMVQAFAGENWHEFVSWTIKKGFSGLENLSFIPGTVGAAPIQNIGAYGSEIKDTLIKVQAYETDNRKIIELTRKECQLKYRYSFFKHPQYKSKFLILSVFFLLKKKYQQLNTSYVEIQKELENMNIKKKPTIHDLSLAIFNIRKKKLPNPKKLGNAGSFFINPVVELLYFQKIKHQYPAIIGYNISNNKIKLSANSLIENIGWKIKKIGNVGMYETKPIILVNYGKATGMEIYSFSEKITKNIKNKFNISLSREVNVIQ
ncbi:UDP-N-acetylmuramate dehydrogenase [Blattabacterium cuenoti]|uniref:UDP-N-acetylmuramate dehydrogenase n=1 Tax=Blattabacterium cuenoti TaxID=1653831 RepID=UPI00163BDCCF|nr:UDP-N-acetylmuramate dehydrogenase [Blattabacterium cuenoti]